jgi:hypothetical protein
MDDLKKQAREALAKELTPEEVVLLSYPGEKRSALVASQRRVLIYKRKLGVNSWTYTDIEDVEIVSKWGFKSVVVHTTDSAPLKTGILDSDIDEAPNALHPTEHALGLAGGLQDLIRQHRSGATIQVTSMTGSRTRSPRESRTRSR